MYRIDFYVYEESKNTKRTKGNNFRLRQGKNKPEMAQISPFFKLWPKYAKKHNKKLVRYSNRSCGAGVRGCSC